MRTIIGLAAFAAIGLALAGGRAAEAQTTAVPGCVALEAAAETALGASASAGPASIGYPGMASANGCQITFTGDGTTFGTSFQAVAAKLDAMMTGRGWTRDPNADADGSTGTAAGYAKGGERVAVSVNYATPKGVCREDAPTASCHPTPAQMSYTITLGLVPAS